MRTPFQVISARFCFPNTASVPQVEELRRDLRIKSQELEVKNAAANDKLKKMVKDQQEAEKKKVCVLQEPSPSWAPAGSLWGEQEV